MIPPAWPRQVCLSRRSGTGPSPRLLLAELDRVLDAEVRFGVVLADAAYGSSSGFGHALSQRGLTWVIGIPRTREAYSLRSGSTWPVRRRADVRARGPSRTSQAYCGARDARPSKMADPSHGGVGAEGPL